MKQLNIITEMTQILFENKAVQTAFLYGSFARQNPSVNSDIDIATVVNPDFDVSELQSVIQQHFSKRLLKVLRVDMRSKLVLYFNELPKAEIAFCQTLAEHDKIFLGSEIQFENIPSSILFDKLNNALTHLEGVTEDKEGKKSENFV